MTIFQLSEVRKDEASESKLLWKINHLLGQEWIGTFVFEMSQCAQQFCMYDSINDFQT